MKNTEVHDGTLNLITSIKLYVVVVGTDVNLPILLSKRTHHSNALLCKPRTGDIYRTIQWLPQHQHINSKRKTFKLIYKHPELELKPISVF